MEFVINVFGRVLVMAVQFSGNLKHIFIFFEHMLFEDSFLHLCFEVYVLMRAEVSAFHDDVKDFALHSFILFSTNESRITNSVLRCEGE